MTTKTTRTSQQQQYQHVTSTTIINKFEKINKISTTNVLCFSALLAFLNTSELLACLFVDKHLKRELLSDF